MECNRNEAAEEKESRQRNRDAYFSDLLNEENVDLDDLYTSQAPFISSNEAIGANMLPSQTQTQAISDNGNVRKRVRNGNFTVQEDLLIISAWLNVSTDAVVGTGQKRDTYWERIFAYFEEHRKFSANRNPNPLMHRWSTISTNVQKFQGQLSQIESRHESGVTEQDKILKALDLYKVAQKTSFPFLHCWHELKNCPKFSLLTTKKRSKVVESRSSIFAEPTSPKSTIVLEDNADSNVEQTSSRPIGRKAAKELAKRSKTKCVDGQDDTKLILIKIRDSQKLQRDERKALAAEFLKIEKERHDREKKKEEREEMLYEEKILATNTNGLDQYQAEYYTSLKEAIIEKRRKIGFAL